MSKPRDERRKDLFRPALDQIIDMDHALVRLAEEIDWEFLEQRFAAAGYNFSLLLRCLADILRALILALSRIAPTPQCP